MQQNPVSFPSAGTNALQLEGVLHIARGSDPLPAAVICHPHPLGGGTMHNGVVMAIACSLASRGVTALRFNFRGVGVSEGAHDYGHGERDDVAGAMDWLVGQPDVDARRVSLVGYSFGACVGLAHALTDLRVAAFAGVALPIDLCEPELLHSLSGKGGDVSHAAPALLACPKFFITGERDQLAPPDRLLGLVDHLPAPKQTQLVPGADHFWWGFEREVGERVAEFIAGQ